MISYDDVSSLINEYAEALDLCRKELSQLTVVEERTYDYAIIRAYSKVLLTCCEIYILLKEGYPEGAFALSRNIYEALVIIKTLLTGKQSNNDVLVKRFFDAVEIKRIKIGLESIQYILNRESHNSSAIDAQKKLSEQLDKFIKKYECQFKNDYWWANVCNFTELAKNSSFPKAYTYQRASGNVHFNAYSIFTYANLDESCILIGDTSKGIEFPLQHSTLWLYCICGLLNESYPRLVTTSTLEKLKQLSENVSKFCQYKLSSARYFSTKT